MNAFVFANWRINVTDGSDRTDACLKSVLRLSVDKVQECVLRTGTD